MKRYAISILIAALVTAGGCYSSTAERGFERGFCLPNNVCNAGLVCVSGFCVRPPDSHAAVKEAGADLLPAGDLPAIDPTSYFFVDLWSGGAKCAISFTLDEGFSQPYTILMPEVERRGWRMTFFIYTAQPTRLNTWSHVLLAHQRGHEVANHTYGHPDLTTLSEQKIVEELEAGIADLKKHLGASITLRSFSYPYENTNNFVWSVVKKYHRFARSGDQGKPVPPNPMPLNDAHNPDWGALQAKANTTDISAVSWHAWIDAALKAGKWLIEEWHGVCNSDKSICGGWEPRTIDEFKQHFDRIQSHGQDIWVAPMGMVGDYINQRNTASFVVLKWSSAEVLVTLKSPLYRHPYDVPLSFLFKAPAQWGWSNIQSLQDNKPLKSSRVAANNFRVHASPNSQLPIRLVPR